MQKSEIKVGQEYALRESRKPDASLQRVRILQHVRGKKWKAEWIEPNPGLVEYVESQNLLSRWKDHKIVLRDEKCDREIQEDNKRHGFEEELALDNVLSQVYESVGEGHLTFWRGMLSGPPDAIDRVKQRAGVVDLKESPYTYVDRFGIMHIPFDVAIELAKAFSAAEPSTVLVPIEATEREWTQQASRPGEQYIVGLLNEYRASWAIIRQWAGYDVAIAQREAYIQQLERLVLDAMYALQKGGLDQEANRLRKAVQRR